MTAFAGRTLHTTLRRAEVHRGSPLLRGMTVLAAVLALAACGDDGGTNVDPPVQPTLTAISPVMGGVGTEVRIEGTGLQAGTAVFFGNLQSPRVELEGGALFALAPAGIQLGETYDIGVVNTNQSLHASDTLRASFTAVLPQDLRVNGVSKPEGLVGMTVVIEGGAFGDSLALGDGKVFFEGADGSPILAQVTDPANDWADDFIVTSVPQGIADTSMVWVETLLGASDSVEFRILQSGEFSPSNINWTQTTPLPQPLQALGAVFVPVEDGPSPANYVFALGGADDQNAALGVVYRNVVDQSGALSGSWTTMEDLVTPVAYHAAAAATAFTAALDTATTAAVLYAVGGIDDTGAVVDAVQMAAMAPDGSLGTWATTTPLPAPVHSAGAVVFRGFLYVAGGASAGDTARTAMYRAPVAADGTLGDWVAMAGLPQATAHGALVSFGPFLYMVGGDTGVTAPVSAGQSGGETNRVYRARLSFRTGDLAVGGGWTQGESMGKARSKHSTVFAGGSLFTTSGIFNGTPGSSENTYATLNSDGTLQPWQGATGSETIASELLKSLYNQAAITFIDQDGVGHVLVLGGADIGNEGTPSASVVWY
ncbi:MAG TPA: hypothetical protein VLA43_02245 [Longimicrobiales bacterium]|nr:hypothetical protein [Longimicrobiales bacterium]